MSDLQPIFAPVPPGYDCANPPANLPAPGWVCHYPDNPPRPIGTFRRPVGLLRDKWDATALNASYCWRRSRPAVTVYDATKPTANLF